VKGYSANVRYGNQAIRNKLRAFDQTFDEIENLTPASGTGWRKPPRAHGEASANRHRRFAPASEASGQVHFYPRAVRPPPVLV